MQEISPDFWPGHFGDHARTQVRDSSVGFSEFLLGKIWKMLSRSFKIFQCFEYLRMIFHDFSILFFFVFVDSVGPGAAQIAQRRQEGLIWGSVSGPGAAA